VMARPTVEEERWLLLADRYPTLRPAVEKLALGGGWKTATVLARVLGVILALLGIGMLGGVLFAMPAPALVGGLALVGAAEWMVAQRRVYRSGVEEMLYLCGAVGVVAQFLIWADDSSFGLGVGCISAAVLLVGWRLLNPVCTTLAAAGFSVAIGLFDANFFGNNWNVRMAGLFCAAVAVAALIAGGREWRRPSHDHMCEGLIIVMPWLGYAWLIASDWQGRSANFLALLAALLFSTVWLYVGVKRRSHATLISAMGSLLCLVHSLHWLLHWPLHWELIIAGGMLLGVAIVVERRLRDRTEGLTSSALDEPAGLDLLQLAGAAHLTPSAGAAPDGVQGQGGSFGGGGASGRF
jgi:hypothetical protein